MFAAALKKKFNFAQTVQSERPDHIFLVRGHDMSGENAWYYVLVTPGKRDIFKSQGGVPVLKLTDYGAVLHSGFGNYPPLHIRTLMKEKYGFHEQD